MKDHELDALREHVESLTRRIRAAEGEFYRTRRFAPRESRGWQSRLDTLKEEQRVVLRQLRAELVRRGVVDSGGTTSRT